MAHCAARARALQATAHCAELEAEAASWQAQATQRAEQAAALEAQLRIVQGEAQQEGALAEVRHARVVGLHGCSWGPRLVLAGAGIG